MSPEHFRASSQQGLDARADIYSLGVVLFELLAPNGQCPFGGTYEHLCLLHTTIPPPELATESEDHRRVVSKCLAKGPEGRYRTVLDLLADLGRQGGTPSHTGDGGTSQDIWEQTIRCVEQGHLNEALRLCSQVKEKHPDDLNAEQLFVKLQQRFERAQRLYTAIERALPDAGLAELTPLLQDAAQTWPDHPASSPIEMRLEVRAGQYESAIVQAALALRRCDIDDAQSWAQRAKELNSGEPAAENARRFVEGALQEYEEAWLFIEHALKTGDRQRAMSLARELDEYLEAIAQAAALPQNGDEGW